MILFQGAEQRTVEVRRRDMTYRFEVALVRADQTHASVAMFRNDDGAPHTRTSIVATRQELEQMRDTLDWALTELER